MIACLVLVWCATSANAQVNLEIPDEVTDQCMKANDASKLPKCLKEGAFGFQMLNLAISDDFFGESAKPVMDACMKSNDDFQAAWTCLEQATKSAVETRSLVGVEKIADKCVVGISDDETRKKLVAMSKEIRSQWFPNETWSGGTVYFPFKGCR